MKKYMILCVLIIIPIFLSSCDISPPNNNENYTQKPSENYNSNEYNQSKEAEKSGPLLINYAFTLSSEIMFNDFMLGFDNNILDKDYALLNVNPFNYYEPFDVRYQTCEDMITSLMASDNSFDIYMILPSYYNAKEIIKNGYYVDMLQHEGIKQKYDLMFDTVKQELTIDGKLFALPGQTLIPANNMFFVNERFDKFDEYSIENINTIEDILDFSEDFLVKYPNEPAPVVFEDRFIKEVYLKAAISSAFDHDEYSFDISKINFPLIKSNVIRMKELTKIVQWSIKDAGAVLGELNSDIFIKGNYSGLILEDSYDLLTLKNIDMGFSTPNFVERDLYVINPSSENIDIVLEFFNDFLESIKYMNNKHINYGKTLYKDESTYTENEFGFPPLIGSTQNELNRTEILLNNTEIFWGFRGYIDIIEILDRYINDEISENTAIQQMQKIMDTVIREYTLD